MKKYLLSLCILLTALTGCANGIILLGDSNLWIGGEDCSDSRSWTHLLKQNVGVPVRSLARSGATWTNTTDTKADTEAISEVIDPDNVIYNQALRLQQEIQEGVTPMPDVIIVAAGTNDAWFKERRPGIFDNAKGKKATNMDSPAQHTTLAGSLGLATAKLRAIAPEAQLIYIGPAYNTKAPNTDIDMVTRIMTDFCRKYHIKFVPLNTRALIDPQSEAQRKALTSDGVHTTPTGARKVYRYIISACPELVRK